MTAYTPSVKKQALKGEKLKNLANNHAIIRPFYIYLNTQKGAIIGLIRSCYFSDKANAWLKRQMEHHRFKVLLYDIGMLWNKVFQSSRKKIFMFFCKIFAFAKSYK